MQKIITVIATSLCFAFVAGATEVPKTEAYLGYNLVRLSADGDIIPSRNANGGIGQFVWNINKGFGVAFEGGAVASSNTNLNNISSTVSHFVIGPRYKFNLHSNLQPFVQALFGGAYAAASTQIFAVPVVNPLLSVNPLLPVTGDAISTRLVSARTSFAMLAGGGLDWKISKHTQIRPFEFDYFQVQPETLIPGLSRNRNNWRYSAGVNFTFGAQ